MTIKIILNVGKKKYKLYDFEAAQLYNKLKDYFDSIGAFDEEDNLTTQESCVSKQKEIGFKGE